jgi:HD-like signal output (HDOD) protein/CheY-like chemotaxis protein
MSTSALSVLFVDDEQKILDGFRRQLREHRARWTMRFTTDGADALAMLAAEPADVIVADMRMPGMSGGELLREVHRRYPETTRIIFSGETDQTDLCRNIGSVHHYLHKPCDPGLLCQAIERTNTLRQRLASPKLRLAVNRIAALPPGGENYRALRAELAREPADIGKIARYVSRDPALTAKVMQLVSSAFFGLPRRLSDPRDAVVLLGVNAIQAIVVAGQIFDLIDSNSRHRHQIVRLWTSSILTGDLAARYAQDSHASRETQQVARLAGVLSLIGRAILLNSEAASYTDVWKRARCSQTTLAAAEHEIYGATYTDIGGYALGLWGLPEAIVNAVAAQDAPGLLPRSDINDACMHVHLARWTLGGPARTLDERPLLDQSLSDRPIISSLIDPRRQSA